MKTAQELISPSLLKFIEDWQEGLKRDNERSLGNFITQINYKIAPWIVSSSQIPDFRPLVEKYRLSLLVDAVDACSEYYLRYVPIDEEYDDYYVSDEDGEEKVIVAEGSLAKFFQMIPLAAYYISIGIDPKIGAQAAYLAGIL